jgi:hypothetical protein
MIRSLFRTLEASIHERLNMIEDVIRLSGGEDATRIFGVEEAAPAPVMQSNHEPYLERIRSLEDEVQTLSARLAALEQTGAEVPEASVPAVHVHQEGKNTLWIEPMRDLAIDLPIELPALPTPPVAPKPSPVLAPVAVPVQAKPTNTLVSVKEEVEVEEEEVEEVVVEAESEAEEEEEAEVTEEEAEVAEEEAEEAEEAEEEAEEAEEDGEGIEIEEFEYKGKTYYRDPENQVYRMVDDELDETPIGTWDPVRQRILFRRPTSA